MWSDGSPVVF